MDLRRLEHACGPALKHWELPLALRVREVADMDEACRFFLDRLVSRGATVEQ